MFYSPKVYWRDHWIFWSFVVAFLLQVFIWFYSISRLGDGDQYFLHYNIIFGVDLVGSRTRLMHLPGGGLLIFLVNLLLSWWLYGKDKFLARLLGVAAVIAQIFLLAAVILIVGLNI